jgi:hypothetical protein
MDDPRQRFFGMYDGLARIMGPEAAWTLTQLLRTGNGHSPLSGPNVTAADVLHLYSALRLDLTEGSAWYLVDVLREMNSDRLPDGTEWPDNFSRRDASGVKQ